MLFRILDNLRSKPKAVREQYSFLFAAFLTVVVGGFWTLSLPERFNATVPGSFAVSTSSVPKAPFANLFSEFKSQFATVKEAVSLSGSGETTSTVIDNNPINMKVTTENKQSNDSSFANYVYEDPSQTGSQNKPTIIIATTSATETSAY